MRLWVPAALDLADTPPVDRGGVAVLFVARDNAALAPDALAHVDMKPVLLAWPGSTLRHPHERLDQGR